MFGILFDALVSDLITLHDGILLVTVAHNPLRNVEFRYKVIREG